MPASEPVNRADRGNIITLWSITFLTLWLPLFAPSSFGRFLCFRVLVAVPAVTDGPVSHLAASREWNAARGWRFCSKCSFPAMFPMQNAVHVRCLRLPYTCRVIYLRHSEHTQTHTQSWGTLPCFLAFAMQIKFIALAFLACNTSGGDLTPGKHTHAHTHEWIYQVEKKILSHRIK